MATGQGNLYPVHTNCTRIASPYLSSAIIVARPHAEHDEAERLDLSRLAWQVAAAQVVANWVAPVTSWEESLKQNPA